MRETPFTLRNPPHPGEHVQEYLEVHGMTVDTLAKAMNVDRVELCNLLDGKGRITPEIAKGLARVFQRSESLWLNIQANYDKAQK